MKYYLLALIIIIFPALCYGQSKHGLSKGFQAVEAGYVRLSNANGFDASASIQTKFLGAGVGVFKLEQGKLGVPLFLRVMPVLSKNSFGPLANMQAGYMFLNSESLGARQRGGFYGKFGLGFLTKSKIYTLVNVLFSQTKVNNVSNMNTGFTVNLGFAF